MSASVDKDSILEQAKVFAEEFKISYDKISIRKSGNVCYRYDTGGSGGWTEGTPAVVVPTQVVVRYAALKQELKQSLEAQIPKLEKVPNNPSQPRELNKASQIIAANEVVKQVQKAIQIVFQDKGDV